MLASVIPTHTTGSGMHDRIGAHRLMIRVEDKRGTVLERVLIDKEASFLCDIREIST